MYLIQNSQAVKKMCPPGNSLGKNVKLKMALRNRKAAAVAIVTN